ncbi:MAG TPA: transporter [Steroidobacteraceae bacterium]|jgi:hypothetical protein
MSLRWAGLVVAALVAFMHSGVASAGPPFLTDDPEPTEAGHWEIYAPALEAAGKGRDFEGSAGAELNYGAAPDLQVTVGLPVSYVHDASGFVSGAGDLEVSVKYRFFYDEAAAFSIAAFPGITLPTASAGFGTRHFTALLPVWIQKDAGAWSLFGGGGYAINPGSGNRNYWSGGIALSRSYSDRLLIGVEADRQGSDTLDGRAETSLGVGAIMRLTARVRLLASAGPTFVDGEAPTRFHAFVAVGLDF